VLQVVCVCKLCVNKLCVRRRREREEEAEREEADGMQNQKQEPHTKMWGTTHTMHGCCQVLRDSRCKIAVR